MTTPHPRARWTRSGKLLGAAAAAASLVALTACSGGSDSPSGTGGDDSAYGFETVEQDDTAPITVWVDASREPAAEAFQEAHPDIEIDVQTYDGGADGSGSFQTQVEAFNQAGSGWPDVVFSTQNNEAAWASQGSDPFAAPLAPTTVDGTVYGLRNDLAPTVLWYDQSLMDQFGYEVPTTWEEYQELGEKVATEHPGYIVGAVGDAFAEEIYFWSGKAPINVVTGVDEFSADTSDPKTVAMAELIDTLLEDDVLALDSVFSPEFVQKYTGKVLMMPGPVWYYGALFSNADSLNAAPGTIAAGLPLAWDGEDPAAGNVGGGTWYISRHSANLEAAATFLEFVTSDDAYQVDQAPGLPAFAAAGDKWLANQEAEGFFAAGFADNVSTAASQVWDGWGFPKFSQEAVWAKTVTPELAAGTKLVDVLPDWEKAIENEAQANGYKVS